MSTPEWKAEWDALTQHEQDARRMQPGTLSARIMEYSDVVPQAERQHAWRVAEREHAEWLLRQAKEEVESAKAEEIRAHDARDTIMFYLRVWTKERERREKVAREHAQAQYAAEHPRA